MLVASGIGFLLWLSLCAVNAVIYGSTSAQLRSTSGKVMHQLALAVGFGWIALAIIGSLSAM